MSDTTDHPASPETPHHAANPLPPRTSHDNADGWTRERVRIFVYMLAESGNVARVCRECDITRQAAYRLRRSSRAFALAWDGAVLRHRDTLVDICMDRAIHGAREEVVIDGQVVERLRHDGATLRFMLARADRLAESRALHDRPARMAEGHLEALVDMLDAVMPDDEAGGLASDGRPRPHIDPAAARELLRTIEDSALPDWDKDVLREHDRRRAAQKDAEDDAQDAQDAARDRAEAIAAGDGDPADRLAGDPINEGGVVPVPGDPLIEAELLDEGERERLAYLRWHAALAAMPAEAIDVADLDPAASDGWSQRDWDRAFYSGMTAEMDLGDEGEAEGDAGEDTDGADEGGAGEAGEGVNQM